jgi:hypothetical protein
MRTALFACCLAYVAPLPAPYWNASGHRIVALIVRDELSPGTRAQLDELLRSHPRHEQDLLAGLAKDADEGTTARHAFASAAVWPDVVRSPANPMHAKEDHPPWHYIDIPYVLDQQAPPAERPPDKPGPRNIVEALQKCVRDLGDKDLPAAERAIALCWVLHLVGDLHQPLHACTLVSSQFPNGDQGGNGFSVMREARAGSQTNLHHFWDSLPGSYQASDFEVYIAAGMRADPRLSRASSKEALAEKDFMAWARESHALAIEHVYLNGTLRGAPASERPDSRPSRDESRRQVPLLPPGYAQQAERIALRRLVLAGFRCADLLEATLAPR